MKEVPMASERLYVGSGVLSSSSGSSTLSVHSGSSSSSPRSSMGPFSFGTGSYGVKSQTMKEVSKMALGTASVGRKSSTKMRRVEDVWAWDQVTPDRPHIARQGSDTEPIRRWRVDDRGWLVSVKQGSSPKVVKGPASHVEGGRSGRGMGTRAASTNNIPHQVHWTNQQPAAPPMGEWAKYESPKVTRGRVLGTKQESVQLTEVSSQEDTLAGSPANEPFPVLKPTVAQVEAFKHYERKARRLSVQEYATGVAPSKQDIEATVAHAGWEAKKSRQVGQISRLYDELYEAYSSSQPTKCGAEVEETAPGHLSVSKEHAMTEAVERAAIQAAAEAAAKAALYPEPTEPMSNKAHPHPIAPNEASSRPQRPGLLIHRKPVGSSTCVPLASKLPTASTAVTHARSASSPTEDPYWAPEQTSLLTVQLRSASASPPKRRYIVRLSPRHGNSEAKNNGTQLPCAFPSALDVEDDIDEPWPPSPTPVSGTVKKRSRPHFDKWKKVNKVPVLFASVPPEIRTVPVIDRDTDDDISLEGPELLYAPRFTKPPPVVWELHPSIKAFILRLREKKDWAVWAVKAVILVWVVTCLWSILDALKGALTRVGWPLAIAWGFVKWIFGY